MNTAYLSLGSNVDAEVKIGAAMRALQERFGICRFSPIYRSRAIGFEGDPVVVREGGRGGQKRYRKEGGEP